MFSNRVRWPVRVWRRKCCWYSAVPRGAPRTVRPCWSRGSAWSATQTSGPRGSKLGGGTPAAFQTLVLPLLSWMCACVYRWCARRSYTGLTLSGSTMA